MSSDRVRSALRAEAAAHRPDRAAILARIERGQAAVGPARAARIGHRRAAVRMAGMGMTVAAVIGLSVAVTWAAVGTDVLRMPSNGPTMAPAAPASRSPGAVQMPPATSRPPSGTQAPRSPAASPSSKGAQQDFFRSSGAIDAHSIDNWTQSNVTVVTSQTVTALDVTVRIADSPDLASTGAWSSVLAEFLVTAIERRGAALVYRFTLKPGVTISPGSYVFAVQYNHASGRDRSRDTYHVVATADDARAEMGGGF